MSNFLKSLYSWAGDPRSGEKKDVDLLPLVTPIKADVYPKKELYFKNLDEIIDQKRKEMEEIIQSESKKLEIEDDAEFQIPTEPIQTSTIQSEVSKPNNTKASDDKPKLSLGIGKSNSNSGTDPKKEEKSSEKPKLGLSLKPKEGGLAAPKLSLNLKK